MVSSACRTRRMAASPLVRLPLLPSSSWAKTGRPPASSPAPMVAAPAATMPFFRNARRFFGLLRTRPFSFIANLLFFRIEPEALEVKGLGKLICDSLDVLTDLEVDDCGQLPEGGGHTRSRPFSCVRASPTARCQDHPGYG